jgi:hypothetical protein
VVGELPNRGTARCRPLYAPASDGVGAFVQVDRDPILCQNPEQIPKQVQRGGQQDGPLAADECGKLGGYLAGAAGEGSENGRAAGAQTFPRAQRLTRMTQAQIQRRAEV